VLKAGAPGDNANKPSQRNSGPTKEASTATVHFAETPKTAAEHQRKPVDWFHRLQMEGLGIRRRHGA
jgi:hypothetical protein